MRGRREAGIVRGVQRQPAWAEKGLDRAAEQAEASGQIGFHALALAEREQGQGEGCALAPHVACAWSGLTGAQEGGNPICPVAALGSAVRKDTARCAVCI